MKRGDKINGLGVGRGLLLKRDDGSFWALGAPTRTSDGFLLATGTMIDPETRKPVEDEMGFPVMHSFFLGRE